MFDAPETWVARENSTTFSPHMDTVEVLRRG
jgi:hypothetical protein